MRYKLTKAMIVSALLAVAACGTVTDTRFDTITVDYEDYPLRTRVVETDQGSYTTSDVRVFNIYYVCKPASPGDCEGAVRRGLEIFDFN